MLCVSISPLLSAHHPASRRFANIPPLLLPSLISQCPERPCIRSREKPSRVDFRPLLRGGHRVELLGGHGVKLLGGCGGSRRRLADPDGWRARGADDGGAEAVAGRDVPVAGDCVDRDVAAAAGVNGRLGPADGRAKGRGAQQQHGNDGKREALHGFGGLFVCLFVCLGVSVYSAVGGERRRAGFVRLFIIP